MDGWIEAVCHAINLILAFATVIIFIYSRKMRAEKIEQLPQNLRLYLILCCFPYSIIISLLSIVLSLLYFVPVDSNYSRILLIVLSFASQQFRFSLLMLAVERIVSTICLEKYGDYSGGISLFASMFIFTYCLTCVYLFLTITDFLFSESSIIACYNVYYVLFLHVTTLIIVKILHFTNNRMYKLLAYRITLRQRLQIVENVKVLEFLWPTIFIFAILAPVGPLAGLIYSVAKGGGTIPPPVFTQLSYNFSFVLMMAFRVNDFLKTRKSETEKPTAGVKSPLGKQIPVNIQMENYFKQLENQWKQ